MDKNRQTTLVWFRQDLRLQDNPALQAALDAGGAVIPVYVWSPEEEGAWKPQGAQLWWLHRSLAALAESLEKRNLRLILRRGGAEESLSALLEETGASALFWNRRYEPECVERDSGIKHRLSEYGYRVESFNGSLLFEPWKISTGEGRPYKVYTPYWKQVSAREVKRPLEYDLSGLQNRAPQSWPDSLSVDDLNLLPSIPWYEGMEAVWTPSEHSGRVRIERFLKEGVREYEECRNFPAGNGTSGLSPYLHFGQISPRQVWWAVVSGGHGSGKGGQTFLKELVWREFATHVLYHFPDTPEHPLRAEFRDFPWSPDAKVLQRWKEGKTGYPLVDAGMRQLWKEGWMHNRIRMVAASLLVKHLLQPWQEGARWFWYTLVDADLANNTLGWQWAGGCGADAAPYFRIFNPILQSEKFDPDGDYIRRYVPELGDLKAPYIHTPWDAPKTALELAGIRLGEDYPLPIIEHKAGRDRALHAFEKIKKS